jgi:hypothetical protein
MRRAIASAVLVAVLAVTSTPAWAGRSTDIALGLASFAVFNQIVAPMLRPRHAEAASYRREVVYRTVTTQPVTVVTQPAVVYAPAPVVVASAPGVAPPTVIQYPHGRYELHWTGQQYVWVWFPAVPAPPPPPPPAAP